MADLHREAPAFIIQSNPWDPRNPLDPLGGRNPYYQGPPQVQIREGERDDPYPPDDPVAMYRKWRLGLGDVVDRLGRHFRARLEGDVITPHPLLSLKQRTFRDDRWRQLAREFFAKHGEPTPADDQRLVSCELTPRQWLELGIRRTRIELQAAADAAQDTLDNAPVGSPEREQPLWDAVDAAKRALEEFDAQARVLLGHTASIETGAVPDNR